MHFFCLWENCQLEKDQRGCSRSSSAEPAAKAYFRDFWKLQLLGPGEIALRADGKVVFHVSDLHACGFRQSIVNHCMVWGSKPLQPSKLFCISLLLGKAVGKGCRLGQKRRLWIDILFSDSVVLLLPQLLTTTCYSEGGKKHVNLSRSDSDKASLTCGEGDLNYPALLCQ